MAQAIDDSKVPRGAMSSCMSRIHERGDYWCDSGGGSPAPPPPLCSGGFVFASRSCAWARRRGICRWPWLRWAFRQRAALGWLLAAPGAAFVAPLLGVALGPVGFFTVPCFVALGLWWGFRGSILT